MQKDQLEILLEDIKGKFDLVLEGHDVIRHELKETRQELCEEIKKNSFAIKGLSARIDTVEGTLGKRIDAVEESLSKKIDAVAADLAAHRADTESHRGYRASE